MSKSIENANSINELIEKNDQNVADATLMNWCGDNHPAIHLNCDADADSNIELNQQLQLLGSSYTLIGSSKYDCDCDMFHFQRTI